MKPLLPISLFILLVLVGCSRPRRLPSGWEETGDAEADSLVMRLEREYGHNAGSPAERWLQPLESIASAHPENQRLKARVAYWRVRQYLRMGNHDRAKSILDSTIRSIDTVKYADDVRHLRMLGWRFDPSLSHRYIEAIDNLEYFRHTGDSTSMAYVLMDLGDIMQQIGDYARGADFCLEASRIWRSIHQDEYADKNLLNVALMSERHLTDSIHRSLLANEKYRQDTSFYELVLRNHFLNTDSLKYLKEAFKLSEKSTRLAGLRGMHLALYSEWLARHGRDTAALEYAREAQQIPSTPRDPRFKMLLAHALAMGYHTAGRTDSAERYLYDYVMLKDSLLDHQNATELANKTWRDEIRKVEVAEKLKAQREKMMFWILLLSILIIFIIISFYFYRRARNSEMRGALVRAELAHTKSRLGREAVIMREKEDLLQSILKEIEEGEAEGMLNPETSSRLRVALKVHKSGEEERKAFLEVHDNMLPGFSAKLKESYPTLSEKQIRLAAYICAGMSSAAIAKVLNITPASVVKNRYRLRLKLNLEAGDSLEDFLRSLAK